MERRLEPAGLKQNRRRQVRTERPRRTNLENLRGRATNSAKSETTKTPRQGFLTEEIAPAETAGRVL
jgi:hypothetical protein